MLDILKMLHMDHIQMVLAGVRSCLWYTIIKFVSFTEAQLKLAHSLKNVVQMIQAK